MSRNGFIFRLIAVLLLIGIAVAGGYMAYRAGVAQGIVQAPDVAKAISQAAQNGQPVPAVPVYGYRYPYGWGFPHPFGFFPFGICGSILLIFLFFGLLRFVFRPWGWRHHGYRGPWGKWEGGVPPMFDEWHKRAHEAPTESNEAEKKV
jgi:hypothetical protein